MKDRSREVFSVVTFIAGLHEHLLKGDLQNKEIGSGFDILRYLLLSMHAEVQTVACDTCFKTGFQFWIDFLKTVSFISMSFLKNFMVTWFM